jgi:hypothetical protein
MEFYDKELIDAAAKEIGFPAEIIADREQRLTNSLLYNFAMGTLYGLSYPKEPKLSELPLTEQIYVAQKKAIEEAAKRGSCVFIGRCADYILKSRPDVLRVFVYADRDIRLRRAIDEYGDLEEHIDEFMHQTDKRRRIYYENYTNQRWGDRENYDLMLECLTKLQTHATQKELDDICMVLDIHPPVGCDDVGSQIMFIKRHLAMIRKFDGERLR